MNYKQRPKIIGIIQTFLIFTRAADIQTLLEFINSYDFRLGGGLTRSELTILLKRSPLIKWCKTPYGNVLYYLDEDKEYVKDLIKKMLVEKYEDNNFITEKDLDLEVMRYVKV